MSVIISVIINDCALLLRNYLFPVQTVIYLM